MIIPASGKIHKYEVTKGKAIAALSVFGLLAIFGTFGMFSTYVASNMVLSAKEREAEYSRLYQQSALELAHIDSQREIDRQKLAVYARTIGQMQASLARLDSMGSRLVTETNLNPNEFNFGSPAASGGPIGQVQNDVDGAWIDSMMEQTSERLTSVDAQLAAVDYLLEKNRLQATARPHVWPADGGYISSRFGDRADPFNGHRAEHKGTDIGNRFGAPVLAASRGIVTFAGYKNEYGNVVEVEHGYGFSTRYAHLSGINARVGDIVKDGQLIGRVGSTGRSTGPHLHYEVLIHGTQVNPQRYLPRG